MKTQPSLAALLLILVVAFQIASASAPTAGPTTSISSLGISTPDGANFAGPVTTGDPKGQCDATAYVVGSTTTSRYANGSLIASSSNALTVLNAMVSAIGSSHTGGTACLLPAYYHLNGTLTTPQNTGGVQFTLRGNGVYGTVLYEDQASTTALRLGNNSAVNLRDFSIQFSPVVTGDCIQSGGTNTPGTQQSLWENIQCNYVDASHWAYNLTNPMHVTLNGVAAYNVGNGLRLNNDHTTTNFGNSQISHLWIVTNTAGKCVQATESQHLLNLVSFDRLECNNNAAYQNGTVAVDLGADTYDFHIHDLDVENYDTGIAVAGISNSVNGATVQASGTTHAAVWAEAGSRFNQFSDIKAQPIVGQANGIGIADDSTNTNPNGANSFDYVTVGCSGCSWASPYSTLWTFTPATIANNVLAYSAATSDNRIPASGVYGDIALNSRNITNAGSVTYGTGTATVTVNGSSSSRLNMPELSLNNHNLLSVNTLSFQNAGSGGSPNMFANGGDSTLTLNGNFKVSGDLRNANSDASGAIGGSTSRWGSLYIQDIRALVASGDTQPGVEINPTAVRLGPGGSTTPDVILSRAGTGWLGVGTGVQIGNTINWAYGNATASTTGGTVASLANTGTGPSAGTQAAWLRIQINGANYWVPVWT